MAVSWADVVLLAPDLASVALASQTAILADVTAQLAEGSWGARYDLGCKLLAAHLGTLTLRAQTGGGGGPVMAESVGGVSRQYAVFSPAGSDALLDTTPWGREFRRVRQQLANARLGFVL